MGRTTTVELDGGLKSDLGFGRGGRSVALLGGIQPVHIGLVVLFVVQLHDLLRDPGLQSVVLVGKRGERLHAEVRESRWYR